jgi:hypothetical protein
MKRRSARVKPPGTSRSFTNLSGVLGSKRNSHVRVVSRSASTGDFIVRSGTPGEIGPRRGGNKVTSPARPSDGQSEARENPTSNSAEDQVQAEAARLRQITDRKLGKTTPAWVSRIADRHL